jgi:hypothetical protein
VLHAGFLLGFQRIIRRYIPDDRTLHPQFTSFRARNQTSDPHAYEITAQQACLPAYLLMNWGRCMGTRSWLVERGNTRWWGRNTATPEQVFSSSTVSPSARRLTYYPLGYGHYRNMKRKMLKRRNASKGGGSFKWRQALIVQEAMLCKNVIIRHTNQIAAI